MSEQKIKEAIADLHMLWVDVEWTQEMQLSCVRPTVKAAADAARQLTNERDEARAEVERLNRELEQAIAERTPHDYGILKDQRDAYRDRLCSALKEAQDARADVEQLKQALHDARLENSGQAAVIEELRSHIGDTTKMVRPEPSRLEIAAMFMARPEWGYTAGQALKVADLLIEAAKGGAE